ncbi:MAG: acetoacetate--CoA ligase [Polaromonas sp.]|jgi:acetoacetyl-CoA synthetase
MRPPHTPQIRLYCDWLTARRGLTFDSYAAMHHWSVTDLSAFWQSIWDYFDVQSPTPHTSVVQGHMPSARWFAGAQVNYVAQVFRHVEAAHAADLPAIISHTEESLASGAAARHISWPALKRQVATLALHLQSQGVKPGDRVAAYLPNIPEAMVAFLATASIGGVWSICAPDMGTAAVLDRFRQIEPKVLIATNGVTYGGKQMDRSAVVEELCAGLPTLEHVIVLSKSGAINSGAACPSIHWSEALNDTQKEAEIALFVPLWLPFDHPLWIVYSSGTTGLPKPIVHGHGGTLIVALALKVLHNDVGCSYHPNSWGERYHWYSSTGWVMWNAQTSGLLNGTTCVIFDGNPGGTKEKPDWTTLWRFAANTGATFFGAGAAFFANCMKADVDLAQCGDLSHVRALGSTGSPLSVEAQQWGTEQFAAMGTPERGDGPPLASSAPSGGSESHVVGERGGNGIWFCNISGGTDFAGAFIGGNRELPQIPGQMQCRLLGCAVESWNEAGEPVIDEVGELVCTQPIPSMPLYFWGDKGNARYISSYFDMYPSVWRHGDWLKITPAGGCIIYGRSDATINRHGLRMGTSELYSAIEALPEVLDSMVVDLEYLGRDSYMPLFVVLRAGVALDDGVRAKLNNAIKTALSPRFVPNEIFSVAEIPRTLSGKKQELPIKKLLLGAPIDKVVNRDAMANPACLDWYVQFARAYAGQTTSRAVD